MTFFLVECKDYRSWVNYFFFKHEIMSFIWNVLERSRVLLWKFYLHTFVSQAVVRVSIIYAHPFVNFVTIPNFQMTFLANLVGFFPRKRRIGFCCRFYRKCTAFLPPLIQSLKLFNFFTTVRSKVVKYAKIMFTPTKVSWAYITTRQADRHHSS